MAPCIGADILEFDHAVGEAERPTFERVISRKSGLAADDASGQPHDETLLTGFDVDFHGLGYVARSVEGIVGETDECRVAGRERTGDEVCARATAAGADVGHFGSVRSVIDEARDTMLRTVEVADSAEIIDGVDQSDFCMEPGCPYDSDCRSGG